MKKEPKTTSKAALEVIAAGRGLLIKARDLEGKEYFFRPDQVVSVMPRHDQNLTCVRLRWGRWIDIALPAGEAARVIFGLN